mmetsp:Transcript_8178/g.24130  ORF Transcript_8178/g.24130 Transcript_8178/m.24130 type:complete len:207 (+) Transcript_8178:1097-1717(+)
MKVSVSSPWDAYRALRMRCGACWCIISSSRAESTKTWPCTWRALATLSKRSVVTQPSSLPPSPRLKHMRTRRKETTELSGGVTHVRTAGMAHESFLEARYLAAKPSTTWWVIWRVTSLSVSKGWSMVMRTPGWLAAMAAATAAPMETPCTSTSAGSSPLSCVRCAYAASPSRYVESSVGHSAPEAGSSCPSTCEPGGKVYFTAGSG